jgi:hypothetical protein
LIRNILALFFKIFLVEFKNLLGCLRFFKNIELHDRDKNLKKVNDISRDNEVEQWKMDQKLQGVDEGDQV